MSDAGNSDILSNGDEVVSDESECCDVIEKVEEIDDPKEYGDYGEEENEKEQDFWSILGGGHGSEALIERHRVNTNDIMEMDAGNGKTCFRNSASESSLEKEENESEDDPFEAISATGVLPGVEDDEVQNSTQTILIKNDVGLCCTVNEIDDYQAEGEEEGEDVDFWAKLQESEGPSSLVNPNEFEDMYDSNSWSLLGSSTSFPDGLLSDSGPAPSEHFIVEKRNDEYDPLGFLDGISLWEETDHFSLPDSQVLNNTTGEIDALDYLDGVTIWEMAIGNYENGLPTEEEVSVREPSIHGMEKDDVFLTDLQSETLNVENEARLSPDEEISDENGTISPTPGADDRSPINHEIKIDISGRDCPAARIVSSTRFPRHSMIPKPKKQNLQQQKADHCPADSELPTPNVTVNALDRFASTPAKPRDRDRGQRRRGRGRGSLFFLSFVFFCIVPCFFPNFSPCARVSGCVSLCGTPSSSLPDLRRF